VSDDGLRRAQREFDNDDGIRLTPVGPDPDDARDVMLDNGMDFPGHIGDGLNYAREDA
jgi:hypothetical protein